MKLIPLAALVYVMLPIDLFPEILVPFVGILDDVVVVVWAFWVFLKLSPKDVLMEHGRRIARRE